MRSALKRVGVALAGALLASSVVVAPAHAEPATLSGTISGDDGAPVQGCAGAYTEAYDWAGSACADDAGHWVIDGLEAGVAYKVTVDTWDGVHLGEWAQDAQSFDEATSYVAPSTVDTVLASGGTISGTLNRADGSPAAWANVTVWTPDLTTQVRWTTVSDDGSFTALVPTGDYKVQFTDWPAEQWAVGKRNGEEADIVHVDAGGTTTVVDQLRRNGSVGGHITRDLDGAPVPGACVTVLTYPLTDDSMYVGESCTDADGAYSVPVPSAGTYAAFVRDDTGTYASEYSGDTVDPTRGTSFDVVDAEETRFDASLAKAASLTGLAVDGKLGTPIADACPSVYVGHTGGYLRGQVVECSGTDGRWRVKGLAAGSYALHLNTNHGTDHWAGTWAFKATSQATADLLIVRPGEDLKVRNVKLAPGGILSGRITDQNGDPVAGAYGDADGGLPGRAGPGEGLYVAQTDTDGRYTLRGLPAGTYTPVVYTGYERRELAPEWSGDADNLASGTPLTVKSMKTTTMNASLAPGGTIGGTVLDAAGNVPQDFLDGDVYDASGAWVGLVWWDGTQLHSSALPGGDFTLSFYDWETGQTVWYDGASTRSQATSVHLARGASTEITFHLP